MAKCWHILFSSGLSWLAIGCVSLPASKLALQPPANLAAAAGESNDDAKAGENAATAAPVRLDVRDLAVVLDTMSRLEQMRPDLRGQMLRELSQTDAAGLSSVVRKWQQYAAEPESAALARTSPAGTVSPGESSSTHHQANSPRPSAAGSSPSSQPPATVAARPASDQISSADSNTATAPHDGATAPDAALDVSADEPPTWEELMQAVVARTHERAGGSQPDAALARLHAALLELIWHSADRAGAVAAPDPELWRQLAPAVELSLGNHASPRSPQEIVESLQVATELLRGPGRFQVRGLAFCKRIRGYDNVERLETATFSAGQPVLLYSEVDHFVSEPVDGGFHTKLSSSLDLLGPGGHTAWRQVFAAVEDQSDGPRRDFFMSHSFRLPAHLAPGRYNLRLTLHDELANRTTSAVIQLTIR